MHGGSETSSRICLRRPRPRRHSQLTVLAFFNFNLEIDQAVEDYVERIVFTLVGAIDEQLSSVQWRVVSKS
ncbi:hypothetical protein MA16_Dca012079 [Dendrobium catenatum]|uniref:Uncharacterized protein n=1 Tax=Dendrobium catenatum TaxID=906689 RepID=A0A2I0WW70_9ASPA|nr:hypothetical protein MA16_Dca012079 [Dendrobium catenatum]